MVTIQFPLHGALLNHRHGLQDKNGLCVTVRGTADLGTRVRVNGVEATRRGQSFEAPLTLTTVWTEITATEDGPAGTADHTVKALWDRYSRKRYRFSIDDNSFFLRDLVRQGHDSLFDSTYLAGLRALNRTYGAKFVLNLFRTTPTGDFSLADMPTRYRGEWRDQADWLALAFHADGEFPDRPYQYATPERLAADLDRVAEEIVRFAGAEIYSPPTVIHWGMCPPCCLPALRERGVSVLSGFFGPGMDGRADVNYNMDAERSDIIDREGALVDVNTGMIFSRVDIVCNNTPVAATAATLEPNLDLPLKGEIADLFTHEQYFWPFYHNYVPDHFERLDTAIRWVTDHGYEPVFFHEGLMGGRTPTDLNA